MFILFACVKLQVAGVLEDMVVVEDDTVAEAMGMVSSFLDQIQCCPDQLLFI